MSTDDDGYTHRPGAARGTDDRGGEGGDDGDGERERDLQGAHPERADRSVGARGWVLLGVLAFSLVGAPLLILFRPPALPYWAALLALPMLPAILLGAVGVWATTRP
ncbi:hypothetical protein [Halorubellus sp. PRR65]|uniref:hypothetical protein n=1 Tax=Halorubellus sp. PRR65 TaxID=3098148 RepID=UPI002B2639AA|nr:hypothetical protein [Halorubellus sp. PRR65]